MARPPAMVATASSASPRNPLKRLSTQIERYIRPAPALEYGSSRDVGLRTDPGEWQGRKHRGERRWARDRPRNPRHFAQSDAA
jgi:hypothetical protein